MRPLEGPCASRGGPTAPLKGPTRPREGATRFARARPPPARASPAPAGARREFARARPPPPDSAASKQGGEPTLQRARPAPAGAAPPPDRKTSLSRGALCKTGHDRSSVFSAPKGQRHVAWGASPGTGAPPIFLSPEGATAAQIEELPSPPRGFRILYGALFQGLAPQATCRGSFGARASDFFLSTASSEASGKGDMIAAEP